MPTVAIVGESTHGIPVPKGKKAIFNSLPQLMRTEVIHEMAAEAARVIEEQFKLSWNEVELVGLGGPWADHLPVMLFLEHNAKSLTIHPPCDWDKKTGKWKVGDASNYNDVGETQNRFGEHFLLSKPDYYGDISKALKKGAILEAPAGFAARSAALAKADHYIYISWTDAVAPESVLGKGFTGFAGPKALVNRTGLKSFKMPAGAQKPAGEQPPAGKKPADKKPADKDEADEESSDEESSDEESADEKPADKKPAGKKPADKKPADKKPADKKQADKKQADKKQADKKQADKKQADKKPGDKKPADKKQGKKPANDKPANQKPAEAANKTPKRKEAGDAAPNGSGKKQKK